MGLYFSSHSFQYYMKTFSLVVMMQNTGEIRIKEPVFIRTLRLQFHCLNPLDRNPKEADIGMVLIQWISCC